MGQAIGDSLPFAIALAIIPIPIIAVVLLLGTPRARTNGPAFAVGWLAGLAVVGAIVLVVVGGNGTDDTGEPATWASLLRLVFGALFLLMAARIWRDRPRSGEEAQMPKWMRAIDDFTPSKSFGAGVVLSVANPKNLVLVIAGATAIAETEIPGGQQAIALAVFVLLGSIAVLAPVAIYFFMGERATEILSGLKDFMAAHNAAIMAVLLLVIGAKLIGDAIAGS